MTRGIFFAEIKPRGGGGPKLTASKPLHPAIPPREGKFTLAAGNKPTCACGAELPPYVGRGRYRLRCEACAANKSAIGKEWRAAHPGAVAAYNIDRRITPLPKACADCGRQFTPKRRDGLVCSEQCRNARKARARWIR